MTRYLLDTHILLWALQDPTSLSKQALSVLEEPANIVYVSAAVVWEIAVKRATGKLHFEGDILPQIQQQAFLLLDITGEHAVMTETLPQIHRDPFDRIQIAQAKAEDLTFLTRDKTILTYPDVKLLKA
ncbi:MAG: type II toxin-antitoxin system VapC family toxin [Catalinimonas sp.]